MNCATRLVLPNLSRGIPTWNRADRGRQLRHFSGENQPGLYPSLKTRYESKAAGQREQHIAQ
jgi:hypothetical protein